MPVDLSDLTRRGVLLPAAALAAPGLLPAQITVGSFPSILVTTLGADPTENRDSTNAIIAATHAAEEIQDGLRRNLESTATRTEIGAGISVIFPTGKYRMINTIAAPQYCPFLPNSVVRKFFNRRVNSTL